MFTSLMKGCGASIRGGFVGVLVSGACVALAADSILAEQGNGRRRATDKPTKTVSERHDQDDDLVDSEKADDSSIEMDLDADAEEFDSVDDPGKNAVSSRTKLESAAESDDDDGDKDQVRFRAASNQVVVTNKYSRTVYYQLRVGNGSWVNYSLSPNYRYTHTVSSDPSIRFDWSFASGIQNAQYTLLRGNDHEFRLLANQTGINIFRITTTSTKCSNSCRWANDGECDDGGPGADYSGCTLGTDCGDCGPR